jgi:hypothetical protein
MSALKIAYNDQVFAMAWSYFYLGANPPLLIH